jgi:hypothetical protein
MPAQSRVILTEEQDSLSETLRERTLKELGQQSKQIWIC